MGRNEEPVAASGCASCGSEATAAAVSETHYRISNMDCASEETLIRRWLTGMPGIADLRFDLGGRTLTVVHRLSSLEPVEKALAQMGMRFEARAREPMEARVARYRVEKMDCPNEERLIRERLSGIAGVRALEFDLKGRTLAVSHELASTELIEKALAEIGMPPAGAPAEARRPAPPPETARSDTLHYRIGNMDCPTEVALIRSKLGKLNGVTGLDFDLMQRTLAVRHQLSSSETIEKALAEIGMKAERKAMPGSATHTVLKIDKMDCPTEEGLIRSRLQNMPGISAMDFNLVQRTLTLSHEPPALASALAALQEIGLPAQTPADRTPAAPPAGVKVGAVPGWLALTVSGLAALAAEVVEWTVGGFHWATVVLALVAIFTGGLPTYRKGWIALRNGNLNMNSLMSIAVTGAMIIGHWPEAAMVMFLFALAEVIEAKSLDRARRAIRDLMDLAPDKATVLQPNGSWAEVDAKEVPVPSTVRVRPGERLALDGVVIHGNSTVDQAPITGESLPVEKAPGSQVFAGTVNQAGSFEYTTTALSTDSTLARIIHAVEAAQGSRAPTQRFVDQFARVYTPIVFIVAIGFALLPPLVLGAPWLDWIYRALVLLVIACPCALVISTPVTIVSGLAAAARRGILIKGGAYLESARGLAVLALDKTGTITHGKPAQTDFGVFGGHGRTAPADLPPAWPDGPITRCHWRSQRHMPGKAVHRSLSRSSGRFPVEGSKARSTVNCSGLAIIA